MTSITLLSSEKTSIFFPGGLAERTIPDPPQPQRPDPLRGLANKVIAAELAIGEKTVKVHRARVMEKMQAQSLAERI